MTAVPAATHRMVRGRECLLHPTDYKRQRESVVCDGQQRVPTPEVRKAQVEEIGVRNRQNSATVEGVIE